MTLLLDLDRTLFDTSSFIDALIDTVLPTLSGSSHKDIRALFEAQRAGSGTLLYELNYDVILNELGVTFEDFAQNTKTQLTPNAFVYDDAIELMKWLAASGLKKQTKILSFGNRAVQSLKAAISPALDVPLLTTDTFKRDYIKMNFSTELGYLVDDKSGQELPTGWTEIHLFRDAPSEVVQLSKFHWQIRSLQNLQTLVQ